MEGSITFQLSSRHATGVCYLRVADAPTFTFITIHKILSSGFFDRQPDLERLRHGEPQKPYRQKSLLTKQCTRLTQLRTRILAKIYLLFFEQYQQKLVENPEYYGTCIINELCTINPRQRLG